MRLGLFLVPVLLGALTACTTVDDREGVDMSRENTLTKKHLREQVDEMRFMHGHELMNRMNLLARGDEDTAEAVVEGTRSDDWLVRSSCHWILGTMGDRRNVAALQAGLSDKVSAVRYQAASSLVKLGDNRGFPTLVEGLADTDLQARYKCIQALRVATGKDFGYRHDGAADDRRQAVGRWLDWLDQVRASAL